LTFLEPSTSSFSDDLNLLAPHLVHNVALYIILRRYDSSETAPFVAITYVPDSAPVRQKMLFASTRLTLVRELGIERFRETIFATTKEELTKEGFEKHDKHVKLDAPLTEEEQSLGDVKRKEAEEGRGMNARKSHVSSGGVSMPISDEAVRALEGLAGDSGDNLVQLVCIGCGFKDSPNISDLRIRKSTLPTKQWSLLPQLKRQYLNCLPPSHPRSHATHSTVTPMTTTVPPPPQSCLSILALPVLR